MSRDKRVKSMLKMCMGKKVYKEKKLAEKHAKILSKKYKKNFRVYWCPICKWFHSTTAKENK